MSQSNTRIGDLPFVAGEDLTGFEGRLVKVSNDGGTAVVQLPTDIADYTPFVLIDGGAAGEFVSVRPLSSDRNVRVTLFGTCDPGDILAAADPTVSEDKGRVRSVSFEPGFFRGVLIAEESGVNGQLVLGRPTLVGGQYPEV